MNDNTQSIQTLEQAELMIRRAGIVENEMVEGSQLLHCVDWIPHLPARLKPSSEK